MYNNERSERAARPVRRNEVKELKVFLKGKTFKIEYSIDALNEILNSDVFSKIQIPVYMHNSVLFREGKKGLSVVGNIISYNPEEGTMKVSIFNKFASKVNTISDPIIFPRVSAIYDKDSDADQIAENIKILGFDIGSEEFYNI